MYARREDRRVVYSVRGIDVPVLSLDKGRMQLARGEWVYHGDKGRFWMPVV